MREKINEINLKAKSFLPDFHKKVQNRTVPFVSENSLIKRKSNTKPFSPFFFDIKLDNLPPNPSPYYENSFKTVNSILPNHFFNEKFRSYDTRIRKTVQTFRNINSYKISYQPFRNDSAKINFHIKNIRKNLKNTQFEPLRSDYSGENSLEIGCQIDL